ncbi:GAF domain-containing protein [Rhizobium sp. 21-4511-3d]
MGDHSDRNDRQRALADFGDFVLDHDDLDEILTEGCRLVAAALGADLAKIMEIERGSNTAIVRAGVGWHDGVIGRARVDLNDRSSEAYAIEESEPVITNDISDESRFVFPRFLRDHGVVALVNVPILVVLVDPWRAYHSIPIETERNFSRPAPVMQMSRQIMPCRRQLKIAARLYALSM